MVDRSWMATGRVFPPCEWGTPHRHRSLSCDDRPIIRPSRPCTWTDLEPCDDIPEHLLENHARVHVVYRHCELPLRYGADIPKLAERGVGIVLTPVDEYTRRGGQAEGQMNADMTAERTTQPPIIEVKDVSRRFVLFHERPQTFQELFIRTMQRSTARREEFWALRDINLNVYPGDSVGIVGRNGSGKSTLLK